MSSRLRKLPAAIGRYLMLSALAIAAIAAPLPFLSGGGAVVSAHGEPASPGNSIVPYRWNLKDAGLPLLSLPDHIRGTVDLSITYSMDQFQFPLFQSLYYNERFGKYILMVMPKAGVRAEFIDLAAVRGRKQFEANGRARLRLEDKGYAKLLTTGEGTVYTFTPLGNGEFHCSQIRDRDGSVINLKYTNQAAIATIADNAGRTINFGYDSDCVSSITQTWGPGSARKQTWPVSNEAIGRRSSRDNVVMRGATASGGSNRTVNFIAAGVTMTKHMPTNARTPVYTSAMAASDLMLATIFGGPGAIAAAHGFEPSGLANQYPLYRGDLFGDDGKLRRGHLSYAMHLYGNSNGTLDTAIYIPSGFISHSNTPTPTDAAVTFFYPRLGNLTNVTLAVFHINNFHLSPEGERVRIGTIGGRGGSIACYRHSHIEFYRGDTGLPSSASRPGLRIDPASVFESMPEMARRSRTIVSARYNH